MRLKYSGSLVFFTCLIISCGIVQAKDIPTEASITFTISGNLAGSVASKLGSGIYNFKLSMPEFVALINKNFVTKKVEGVQKVLSIRADYVVTTREPDNSIPVFESRTCHNIAL